MSILYGVSGHPFYRQGNNLYDARSGEWVGEFRENEIVDGYGQYVGELVGGRVGRSTTRLGGDRGAGRSIARIAPIAAVRSVGAPLAGFVDP